METKPLTNPMATVTSTQTPPQSVLRLLDDLRSRIRWYVIVEGVAMLIVWLVVAFWIGFALDYLPVLMGANEMPRAARAVFLAIVAAGTCAVLYYYILRRVFSTLKNSSLALLIERQFPSFRDSLVTTVERTATDSSVNKADREAIEAVTSGETPLQNEMFARTVERAESSVRDVQLSRVFRYAPLASKLFAAFVALASLVLLAVFGSDAFGIGASRLLLMSDEPWPRRAHIELVGFDDAGEKKVAKGTDLTVRVRAEANREFPPPELCSILYQTNDGARGRVNMSRDGEAREGYQYYVFTGKPFKGILNDIRFDVIGYDHRLRDQHVKVVLSPVVTEVKLRAELPKYTGLLPREELWSPGLQLPIGSAVTARIQSSKDLVSARIRDIDTGEEQTYEFPTGQSTREIVYGLDDLDGRVAVSVSLMDTDGIESLEPFLLTIGAVEDEIPKVEVALRGIGSAITANARLAVEGKITDDYDIARRWFNLKKGDDIHHFDLPASGDELAEAALDLRDEANSSKEKPFQLQPQDRVVFSVKATDKFDLDGLSHTGSNDPTILTVVRPDELLAILDGRELGLRRRFEQMRTEMQQSRDSLARLRGSFNEQTPEDIEDVNQAEQNLADLRDRWASWAGQKADQTVLEVEGIAFAFEDIREELVNNRVDTPERKTRMEQQIIAPLRTISNDLFPQFSQAVRELRGALSKKDAAAESRSIEVLANADRIIVAMDDVLAKMLELEDYAELVNVVRQLIEQQESLQKKAKEEQKARVLDLFK